MVEKKNSGLAVVDDLERELGDAWDAAAGKIANGEAPALALSDYEREAAALIETYYSAGFLTGLPEGQDDVDGGGIVPATVAAALGLLAKFMANLIQQTAGLTPDLAAQLMANRRARALMYAGGSWGLYVKGKLYGADPNEIWEWYGPIDARSCRVCAEEVWAGPRPLHEIKRFPVEDTPCLSNCRHDVRRRKDLEV